MQLSRAVRSLRTLTRPQRAFSAAPQPVYEPHVVLHQRPDQDPAADGATRSKAGLRRCEKNGRIFQNNSDHPPRRRRDASIAATPPPRRPNSSTPPPRRQNSSAAHPSTKTQVPQQKIDENGGLMEYSVVYTDRAMNHMSAPFQEVTKGVEINDFGP